MKREPKTASPPASTEPKPNGKPVGIRYASKEQFAKAQRKTRTLHAGLFRRLAE